MKVLEDTGSLLIMVLPLVGGLESRFKLAMMFLTTCLPYLTPAGPQQALLAIYPTWLLQRPSYIRSVECPRQGYAASVWICHFFPLQSVWKAFFLFCCIYAPWRAFCNMFFQLWTLVWLNLGMVIMEPQRIAAANNLGFFWFCNHKMVGARMDVPFFGIFWHTLFNLWMNLSVIWSEKVNKAFLDCCLLLYSER